MFLSLESVEILVYHLCIGVDEEDWAELSRYKVDVPGGLTPIGDAPLVGTTERRRHFLEWAFYEIRNI